jgi:serine/threonine protein kinase
MKLHDIRYLNRIFIPHKLLSGAINTISLEDQHIGKGAFGKVHRLTKVNDDELEGYVLKVIDEPNFIDETFKTLKFLHDKIQSKEKSFNKSYLEEFPELAGLPFIIFKAQDWDTGLNVSGFLMRNLTECGYEDLGSDDWNIKQYIQKVGFEEKLYLGYRLVKVLKFLNELNFIHCDLKDYSIFINKSQNRLALIDFDGGYNFDKQNSALTIGAINAWAGKLIKSFIKQGKGASDLSKQDRIDEEKWNVASALFQILFGIPQYSFLRSMEDESIEKYLIDNRWPNIDANFDYINQPNIPFFKTVNDTLNDLKAEGLNDLVAYFERTFNEGHSKPAKRSTTDQWLKTIEAICKQFVGEPQIKSFTSDKTKVTSNEELIKFNWKLSLTKAAYLRGEFISPFELDSYLSINDTEEISIKAINEFGSHKESILINANKIEPKIIRFNSDIQKRVDNYPVTLSWHCSNCKHVLITKHQGNLSAEAELVVDPREKTEYTLKAVGYFDQITEASVFIDVETVLINNFRYQINIEKGIENIDLFWSVENAQEIRIEPRVGSVSSNGQYSISISGPTVFKISAQGYFDKKEFDIEAKPFPIPIIKSLFVPAPILQLDSKIEAPKIDIELFKKLDINLNIDNAIELNTSMPDFTILQKEGFQILSNKLTHSPPSSITTIFNQLLKRTGLKN